MYEKLLSSIYALERNTVFSAIKKGFILLIPAVLTGSIALLIRNFPIPIFQVWIKAFAGGAIDSLMGFLFDATVGFMAAYLVLAISYYYACSLYSDGRTHRLIAMITAFACFVASFGGESGSLQISSFGPVGVFTAMVCAVAATKLFHLFDSRAFYRLYKKYVKTDISGRISITAVWSMFCTVLIFALANFLLNLIFHVENFNDLISSGLISLFENIHSELANGVAFTGLLNFLWIFGIHGGNALDQVAQTVFVPADANPSLIISKSFLDNFVMIGGSGTTICLLLALLIASRSSQHKLLAHSAAPLILFNINEILVFGLPIVLNPIMVLPFILVPLCALFIAYGATLLGIMPAVGQSVTWTTPVFISGYLATDSLMGAVVQAVIVVVGTLIYIPFVRVAKKLQDRRASYMLDDLSADFKKREEKGNPTSYLSRYDNLGTVSKSMVNKLEEDMKKGEIPVYYQPQIDREGNVAGVEALLRWEYAQKPVYPPIVVSLAKENECYNELTWCILKRACEDAKRFSRTIHEKLKVSVNITADQLDHSTFVYQVVELASKYGVCENLMLEVTEEGSLSGFTHIKGNIEILRKYGIYMAIDDFSMGQTSLDYLRENAFHTVKLDGALVKQVADNPRCAEIITSIVELGKNLDFDVVAEYVENETIYKMVSHLGCKLFQGYLYAPALDRARLEEFCQNLKMKTADKKD